MNADDIRRAETMVDEIKILHWVGSLVVELWWRSDAELTIMKSARHSLVRRAKAFAFIEAAYCLARAFRGLNSDNE